MAAYNRQPYNRAAFPRGYVGGGGAFRSLLSGGSGVAVNVYDDIAVGMELDGRGALGTKRLSAAPVPAAYNRQPYNRAARRTGYAITTLHLNAALNGRARSSAEAYGVTRINTRLAGTGAAAQGLEIYMPIVNSLEGDISVITGVNAAINPRSILLSKALLGANVFSTAALDNELAGKAHLGGNIWFNGGAFVNLTSAAALGADIYASPRLWQALMGDADVRNIERLITIINGELPPGAVLVIDADNFNMTLQREGVVTDVIHWHKGSWINVGRATVDLTLSAIGESNWEVFYNARYL